MLLKKENRKGKEYSNGCWVGNQQRSIKEYTLITVRARNDKNLNLCTGIRNREQWKVLKVSNDWLWHVWKQEKMKNASKFYGLGKWKLGSDINKGRGNRMWLSFQKKDKKVRLWIVWNIWSLRCLCEFKSTWLISNLINRCGFLLVYTDLDWRQRHR